MFIRRECKFNFIPKDTITPACNKMIKFKQQRWNSFNDSIYLKFNVLTTFFN